MKTLTFFGPLHHFQLLSPILSVLKDRGWENIIYTANAEACFEHGLQQTIEANWEWLPFYNDARRQEKMYNEALPYFRQLYEKPGVLSYMIAPITDRVIRETVCDFWATKKLLEKIKPTVCLALHELNRWGMLLGYWCNVMRIPFYTFQEGMYYGNPWIYTGHTKYSTSLMWGEAGRDKLLASNADPNKIKVVGHPDLAKRWADAEAQKDQAWALLPPAWKGKRIVIIYITNVGLSHIDVATLLKGIENSDWRVVVRIAFLSSKPLTDKVKEFFAPFPELAFVTPPEPEHPLWPLLAIGEALCVLGCSTLSLEWLAHGKPLAEAYSPGQALSFKEAGVAVDGGNPFTILDWIKTAEETFAKPEHQEKVKAFVKSYIEEDNAAEKLADIIGGKVV